MRGAVRKWGNSRALRIPRSLAEDSSITDGSEVDVTVEEGRLVVTPLAPSSALSELVARITAENRHGELSTGRPVGREAW